MTRLVPGQRLWPLGYNSAKFDPPVTVTSVGRTRAKVALLYGRTDDIPAEDDSYWPGMHPARREFSPTYYTDAGRIAHEARLAVHRSRRDINAALDKGVDIPTLNRVLSALGLPEVVAWTPPENE